MSTAIPESGPQAEPARLKITEIFLSLQGESRTVGIPTVFVRLTGCPLRCQYCDTAYAQIGGVSLHLFSLHYPASLERPGFAVRGGPVRRDKGPLDLRLIPAYPCSACRLTTLWRLLPSLTIHVMP